MDTIITLSSPLLGQFGSKSIILSWYLAKSIRLSLKDGSLFLVDLLVSKYILFKLFHFMIPIIFIASNLVKTSINVKHESKKTWLEQCNIFQCKPHIILT